MESYLALHQMSMEPFMAMSKSGRIKTEMIESSMPPQVLKMYELITSILKKSHILEEESAKEGDISLIVSTVLRVQDRLLMEKV